MKKIALILVFTFALINLNAQDSFSEKFLEANTLIEENQYNVALPLWLKLLLEQPNNNNVNYKAGFCYLKSANDKGKSLSYLEKAVKNTTKNYDPFSGSEKKAPVRRAPAQSSTIEMILAMSSAVRLRLLSCTIFFRR